MRRNYLATLVFVPLLFGSSGAFAARLSDVRGTVHNFAHSDRTINYTLSSGPLPTRTVTAVSQQPDFCIFCHTAHNPSPTSPPLWNKEFSLETYTPYTSSSLDALSDAGIAELAQPDDKSKMCLSCHDGTLAIGTVSVFQGQPQFLDMSGTTPLEGAMPASRNSIIEGATTGYTPRQGVDLRNDHPISVTYTASLALRDGELRSVDINQKSEFDNGLTIGPRADRGRHKLPLFGAVGLAQIQCPTCHDPHVRDDDPGVGNQKFLRLNRFQELQPGNVFSEAGDIMCLACHDKGGDSWAFSAHANDQVGLQTYRDPSHPREFPADLPVWKASCLNCHDSHTVEGARWLLREGTDSPLLLKAGGSSASEETCFQCHNNGTDSIINNTPAVVPDIKSDYDLAIRMPIRSGDQRSNIEEHEIGGNFDDTGMLEGGASCNTPDNGCGADFVERRLKLGVGNLSNRHAECSDCHNPHRVVKFKEFLGNFGSLAGNPDASGTHRHDEAGYMHTNIASGVLRGMTGVEPIYSTSDFQEMPTSFNVKRGDPVSTDILASAVHVTREYQICLKCHSNYGYADNNDYSNLGNRPKLMDTPGGGTISGTNGLTQFTNQAKEFQAPLLHQGDGSPGSSGASAAYTLNNQRSWHPVMGETGRTPAIRGNLDPSLFTAPWNVAAYIGNQTMYCSDCHGSDTGPTNGGTLTTVVPVGGEQGNAWGPHGSTNNFLLKGQWKEEVGEDTPDALCFRCHDYNQYANPTTPSAGKKRSGFSGLATAIDPVDRDVNLHVQHAAVMAFPPMKCTQCHEAVSHGWKNKSLLVNLNDVGPEAGQSVGTVIPDALLPYSMEPYYLGAMLKIDPLAGFSKSGEWKKTDCSGCH